MKHLFSIGEVAKLKGTTVKTLRYYDKIGLLKPAYVDPHSRYRYYTLDQMLVIEHILMFKNTGASLEDIDAACKDNNSLVLADFCFAQIEEAKKQIAELTVTVARFRELAACIYHSKARSVNKDIYIQYFDARTIVSRPCTTPPTHDDTYDIYFHVYNYIREKHLSTIYATGSMVKLDMNTREIAYEKIYVEAKETEFSEEFELQYFPSGYYLCVNYFSQNKAEQLKKLIAEIKEKGIHPELVIEADTFLAVTQYINPMMELQVFFNSFP